MTFGRPAFLLEVINFQSRNKKAATKIEPRDVEVATIKVVWSFLLFWGDGGDEEDDEEVVVCDDDEEVVVRDDDCDRGVEVCSWVLSGTGCLLVGVVVSTDITVLMSVVACVTIDSTLEPPSEIMMTEVTRVATVDTLVTGVTRVMIGTVETTVAT